jgi:hypothetical protein
MEDFCIKCTSPEQGQEIKAYIESLGFDTSGWYFDLRGYYYGITGGEIERRAVPVSEVITLPEKPLYPCEMLVWDSSEDDALECIVVAELKGARYPFICVSKDSNTNTPNLYLQH